MHLQIVNFHIQHCRAATHFLQKRCFFFQQTAARGARADECPPAMSRKDQDCLTEKETTENASYREKTHTGVIIGLSKFGHIPSDDR